MTLKQSTKENFQLKKISSLLLIFLLCAASLFAQGGSVDLSFNASVSKDLTPSESDGLRITLQPDGKIVVFGSFQTVNGVQKARVVRLNPDGSVDSSFNCACANFTVVTSVLVQPDGKLVIGGYFQEIPFGTSSRLARLNADGSRDNSFTSPFSDQGGLNSYSVSVSDIQPDGKLFVYYSTAGQFGLNGFLYRLNPNGSFDNTFATMNFGSGSGLSRLQVLPDGKIMMSGNHNFGSIFRVNPNGTKDTTFESPSLVSSQPQSAPIVGDFAFQSDGKILITGNFSSINGVSRLFMARLNPGGSLDLNYQNTHPAITVGTSVEVLSNDKILIRTGEGAPNSEYPFFFRLNADGTPDNTFNAFTAPKNWRVDAQDRVVFSYGGTWTALVGRMTTNGSPDMSFTSPFFGFVGEVTAMARQSDGKIIIGGIFSRVNGFEQGGITRLNPDGSLDTTFNAGSGNSGIYNSTTKINAIVIQPDGKILIGGNFWAYNGDTARGYFARLNANGSIDQSFSGHTNEAVNAIAVQPDGKILVGGIFTGVNGVNRPGLARFNFDGTPDNSFNPVMGASAINTILVQTDGKIMVGGAFNGVNGFNRQNLVRFNADSSLDESFNAGNIGGVFQVLRQPDGKYPAMTLTAVTRRNADGSVDASFTFPTSGNAIGSLNRMLLQSDGSIIIAGSFSKIGDVFRSNIARLRSNGTVDAGVFPVGADRRVNDIIAQPDGKLIVGGFFTVFENVARSAIAGIFQPIPRRIINFDYDGDGKSDVSVFRPSENKWYVLRSSDGVVTQQIFAVNGDVPVPSDYDGDGKTDFAIYRQSSGDWWYLSSINGNQGFADWGQSGVIARPSDFDGDGKSDYIFFLPSNSTWYRYGTSAGASYVNFGLSGDKPVIGDFDGDGKSDVAIFRPSTGDWWWQSSVDNVQRATHWGISTDIPAPADYDGDGKTDFAVYRPSTGVWYIYNSATLTSTALNFGISEDKPVAADYDGDGKSDIAVFRPSTGVWYLMKSTEGFTALQFGVSTDIPTENAFVP